MAQNFFQQGAPVETGLVREYVSNLQTNTDTLRSNFSGSIFPSNPVVGQKCFRADEQVEYTFTGDGWVQSAQLSTFATDIVNARGSLPSLHDRLNVAINPDGTLKNPIAAEIDEWKDTALSVAYVADNQFSVVGNLLPTFTKGRSLKIYNQNGDGEISVGGITSVVSSTVSGENTIVTVADSIITGDLYDVKYGLIQESVIPQRNSLQRSTAYNEKDIAYSDKLKSYMYLECIVGGTTGVTEPSYRTVTTPSDVGEAVNVTLITANGGTTGTVTSGGTFTGASNETIYVKLSTSTPSTVEPYDTITLSYCVGSQTGTYTEVGLADGEPQEIVDGVTVQISTTGVFEDGETYSIACVAEVANEADIGDTVTDGTVTWKICRISNITRTEYENALNQKVDKVTFNDLFRDTAAAHNCIYRGKDLTEYWNSGEMSAAIADGSFRDIYPGDFIIKTITIDGTTYTDKKSIVMDLDYFLAWVFGGIDTHHIVMMPEDALGTQYMNSTNITTGGYVNSYMHKTHIPKVNAGIVAAFGSAHVLSHQEYLTNTVDTSKPSGAGSGYTGCATNWVAVSGLKCCLCSENMVYGGRVWGSAMDTGCASKQLAAFRHNQQLRETTSFWLRAVSASTAFAYASGAGLANGHSASGVIGVRPYYLLA